MSETFMASEFQVDAIELLNIMDLILYGLKQFVSNDSSQMSLCGAGHEVRIESESKFCRIIYRHQWLTFKHLEWVFLLQNAAGVKNERRPRVGHIKGQCHGFPQWITCRR